MSSPWFERRVLDSRERLADFALRLMVLMPYLGLKLEKSLAVSSQPKNVIH